MRFRRFVVVALLSTLTVSTLVFGGTTAFGETSCSSSGSTPSFGATKTPSGSSPFANGARATIEMTSNPNQCNPGSFVSQSEADAEVDQTPLGGGVATFGLVHLNGLSTPLGYIYYNKTGSGSGTTLSFTVSGDHTYSVDRYAADGDFHFLFDGADEADTTWDSHSQWTASSAFWLTFGDNAGDDIWGTSSDHQHFGSTDYKDDSNNWNNPSYSGYGKVRCWVNYTVDTSGKEFHAWTSPISHSC